MTADFTKLLKIASGDEAPGPGDRSILPGDVFVLDAPDRIDAVWGDHPNVLWARGEGCMIAGQQGSGKTTIAQQLVLAALGLRRGSETSFLELPVAVLDGVLYLAMDRPTQARRSFRRMVSDSPEVRKILEDRLFTWSGPLPGMVTARMMADPYALAEWVIETYEGRVRAVVFDSVKDIMPDLSDGKVGQAINSSWQGLLQSDIEVLALHHDRKSGSGESRTADIDAIYGSAWLTSGMGSVIKILGEPGSEEVVLHHVKQPGEPVGPIPVLHTHDLGTSVVNDDERQRTVEEILLEAGRALTTSEIAFALTGSDDRSAKQAARRKLRKAVDKTGSVMLAAKGAGRVEDTWQLLGIVGRKAGR